MVSRVNPLDTMMGHYRTKEGENVALYDTIRQLAESRGKSINMVEADCELSFGAIGKWNKSSPQVKNIRRVADYFGLTLDELLKMDDGKEENENAGGSS